MAVVGSLTLFPNECLLTVPTRQPGHGQGRVTGFTRSNVYGTEYNTNNTFRSGGLSGPFGLEFLRLCLPRDWLTGSGN